MNEEEEGAEGVLCLKVWVLCLKVRVEGEWVCVCACRRRGIAFLFSILQKETTNSIIFCGF